jgi:hypothetical protein
MWAVDVERRRSETHGRADREKKCNVKRVVATAADEQARLISINFGQSRVSQFPGGAMDDPRYDRLSFLLAGVTGHNHVP